MAPRTAIDSLLIIESLSPEDLADGTSEAAALKPVLRLLGVPCLTLEVRSRQELRVAMRIFGYGQFDHLHISSHGDEKGIALTDGSDVSWSRLAETLEHYIHEDCSLSVSACRSGTRGLAEAFEHRSVRPWLLSGTKRDIPFGDAVIGWAVFFRQLLSEDSPDVWRKAVLAADTAANLDPTAFLFVRDEGMYRYIDVQIARGTPDENTFGIPPEAIGGDEEIGN